MMTIDRTSYSVSMIGVYKKVSTEATGYVVTFSHFHISTAAPGIWTAFRAGVLCRCHLDVPHDARSSDGSLLRSDCQRREL
jgi:hypothetical protein